MFWDATKGLIPKVFTSDTDIDPIYCVYDEEKLIVEIVKLMAKDRQVRV